MKMILFALSAAVVAFATDANAQTQTFCRTESNGYTFAATGFDSYMTRLNVINACIAHRSTNNTRCQFNVVCDTSSGYPPPTPGYPPTYPQPTYPQPSYPVPSTRPSFPYGAIVLSPYGRTYAYLPSCGGTAELNVVGGQVNIVFRNVRDCSKFDILSTQGYPIAYGLKNLGGYDRNRSGSFTLPRSVIDYGRNGVMVQIRSNSGKHDDVIYLDFYAY